MLIIWHFKHLSYVDMLLKSSQQLLLGKSIISILPMGKKERIKVYK